MPMPPTTPRSRTLAAAIAIAAFATPASAPAQQEAALTGGLEAVADAPRLIVSPGALVNRTVSIRGRVERADAGRWVRIERRLADETWQPIAGAVVGRDGAFATRWRASGLGRTVVRAIVARDSATTAMTAAGSLTVPLTIFRPATATWYGPGFFGRRTACGQRLTRTTIGVAHRTLPCGTRVDVYHRGRILSVPVIDRGPFNKGRAWDLTQAAARALGILTTVRVGVLVPPVPAGAARR